MEPTAPETDIVVDNSSGDCWTSSPTRRQLTVIPSPTISNNNNAFPMVNIPLENMKDGFIGVTFHDVCYELPQTKCCCIKKPNKIILNSVSGCFTPGVNAIMGPTGSGKTSLLDIIAGRKGKSGVSGAVLVNAERQPDNFKCASGYVVQDDRLMGTLSVRENLYFSAALRLPNSISWKEKRQRVQKIIEDLGLTACADTKIGNEFFRGVSGGERKRTNIGMELIIEPQVLFLDEPTTGLDAFTAVSVIQLLKKLCSGSQRVIIMAIHQPRYSIFKLFDSLTLLSRGNIIYHGVAHGAIEYFSKLGDPVEQHDNPADHFLDVLIAAEKASDTNEEKSTNLTSHYSSSREYSTLRSTIDPLLADLEKREDGVIRRKWFNRVSFATGFFWQLLIVAIRSLVNVLRNPTTSVFQLAFNLGFGLAIGIIYFQLDFTSNGFRDRMGVIFFIITNTMFGSLSSIDVFIEQRAQFLHENTSGYYRLSAFYISKIFTDLLPVKIVTLSAFAVASYFLLGFQLAADKFFIFLLLLWLISLCASSLGLFFGAAVGVASVAQLLIATSFVLSMMFGGFLVSLESLPPWVQWLQYISVVRYATEALAANELNGIMFNVTAMPECSFTGNQELTNLGFNVDWLWYDVIALAGFTLLFLIMGYIALLIKTSRK